MRFRMKLVPVAILAATITALSMAVTVRTEDEKPEGKEAKLTQKDLPAAVLAAFKKSYPKAEIKGIDKEADSTETIFEIESVDGTAKRTTVYTADGKLSEVEDVIAMKDLPQAAQQELATNYPKGETKAIERVTRGDVVTFEVMIESGDTRAEIAFDKAGNVIKSEKKAEDEEGEEEDD